MKKKFLYFSSIFILTMFFLIIIFTQNTYSEFNSSNVKKTIEVLSSRSFNGRLAGSAENSLTCDFIKEKFTEYGLKDFKGSYIQEFNTVCPVATNSTPYLKIYNGNDLECELKYGVDFKEDMINFKNNTFSFSSADTVAIMQNNIQVKCSNGNLLLYVSSKDSLNARSSFSSDFIFDSVIMITDNTYKTILAALKDNKSISLSVPFTSEERSISNVVGVIKGINSSLPPLYITAHFDHLGSDGAGNLYGGALDNASGTAFMLELARTFSTYVKPNRDIVFVALNAEELGLLGSKNFAENNILDLKGSQVINFDMIGSADTPITLMQGTKFKNSNSKLLTSIEDICKANDVSYKVEYQDSSDHASFNNNGIDSLTFCHSDMSKIHTPNDTVEYINVDAINSVYDVVEAKIKDYSYSSFTLLLYKPYLLIILPILIGLLLAYPIICKNSTLLNNKCSKI